MAHKSNPYHPPHEHSVGESFRKPKQERKAISIVMILGGLVFFFSSTHALFGRGPDYLTYAYHSIGRFAFAFLLFYGLAGFFTAAFHFSYLAFGKPNQAFAAIYAIGIAVGLVLVSLALMEWLMSQRVF